MARRIEAAMGWTAALWLAAAGACSGEGMAAAAGADGDADADTDPAPDPLPRNGGVLEGDPSDECDRSSPASFAVTPADPDDTVGPALARLLIESGRPLPDDLKIHEFVSYYLADLPVSDAPGLRAAAAVTARDDGAYGLEVLVAADAATASRPLNLVLAVDTSEAMGATRMARVRQCCVALASALRAGDVVGIAALDAQAAALLAPQAVDGPSDPALIAHCNAIDVSGARDLSAGLAKAYALAEGSRDGARLNRVVVMTGGGAGAMAEDVAMAAEAAQGGAYDRVVLVGIGVGDPGADDPYERADLDALTAAGEGPHVLVDSAEEAVRVFGDGLFRLVGVAAESIAVAIELPPALGIESLDGAPLDELTGAPAANRVAPGGGVAIHHRIAPCDGAAPDLAIPIRIEATAFDPATGEEIAASFEAPLADLVAASAGGPSKRDAVVAYALALDAAPDLDPDGARQVIDAARAEVQAAAAALPDDPDLAEIAALLDAYRATL